MCDGVLRIVLDRVLQRGYCGVGVALTYLNLAEIKEVIGIVGVAFQDFVVHLAGFVKTIGKDKELGVVLLDLPVRGMVMIQLGVFGGCLVQISGGEVKVSQHTIAG